MGQKILLDIVMVCVLLALMAYSLIGERAHEILGAAMAVLFAIHQIKNFNWYKNLFKGKYTFRRVFSTLINFALLILTVAQLFSGVVLSKELFVGLNINFSAGTARLIHLAAAYWLFILISVHIGLHWKIILSFAQKKFEIGRFAQALGLIFAAYGLYALIQRQFLDYMFLKSEFVFFNFAEPLAFFIVDCAAIMAFFIFLASKI